MPRIKCKVELKLYWTKYYLLSAAGADYIDANSENIIFTIKVAKLYAPVVTSSKVNNRARQRFYYRMFVRL